MKKPLQAGLLLVLLGLAITAAYGLRQQPPATAPIDNIRKAAVAPQSTVRAPRLVVAFRLDPELTQGVFLGDRWVSPPSYFFAQEGTRYVVQAKVQNIDSRGERADLSGDWSTGDPQMVAINQRSNGEVTIVISRPGESDLTVSTGSGSKTLHVRAKRVADAMQVDITQ